MCRTEIEPLPLPCFLWQPRVVMRRTTEQGERHKEIVTMTEFLTPEHARRQLRRKRILAFVFFLVGACVVVVALLEVLSHLGL